MKDVETMKYKKASPSDKDYTKVKKIYEEVLFILEEDEIACDFDLVYALYKKYFSKISDYPKFSATVNKKTTSKRRYTVGGNRKRRMSKKKGGNDDCRDCMKGSFLILGTGAIITFIMCGGMSRGNMHSVYGQVFMILGIIFVSILGFAIVMGISPAFINFFSRRCRYLLGVCQGIRDGLYENVEQLRDEIQTAEAQPVDGIPSEFPRAHVDSPGENIIYIDAAIDPNNVEPDPVNRICGRFLCYIYWLCQRDIEVLATPVVVQPPPPPPTQTV